MFLNWLSDNFNNYDIIIVSKKYHYKLLQLTPTSEVEKDFFDRIYVGVPVYKIEDNFKQQIGISAFKKGFPPRTPYEYMNLINNNYSPSKAAIRDCIAKYNNCGIFNTLNTFSLINYINNFTTQIHNQN